MSVLIRPPAGFFYLPQELQDEITGYIYPKLIAPPSSTIVLGSPTTSQEAISAIQTFKSLRLVCQHFREKADEIFFSKHRFQVHIAGDRALVPSLWQKLLFERVTSIVISISLPGLLDHKVFTQDTLVRNGDGNEETAIGWIEGYCTLTEILIGSDQHVMLSSIWESRLRSKAPGTHLLIDDLNPIRQSVAEGVESLVKDHRLNRYGLWVSTHRDTD